MTAQVPDFFVYADVKYSIAGANGQGLFDPTDHGIQPVPCSTAMWRGFGCTYALRDERLVLQDLGLFAEGDPPLIFGVQPEPSSTPYQGQLRYADIGWEAPFSGGILLGCDFIQKLYVHMGFHPAWKFRKVHELIFEKGQLTQAHDRSKAMHEFRERMAKLPRRGGNLDEAELMGWIQQCFSLDYEWWGP
jgi:hypothetical protein